MPASLMEDLQDMGGHKACGDSRKEQRVGLGAPHKHAAVQAVYRLTFPTPLSSAMQKASRQTNSPHGGLSGAVPGVTE